MRLSQAIFYGCISLVLPAGMAMAQPASVPAPAQAVKQPSASATQVAASTAAPAFVTAAAPSLNYAFPLSKFYPQTGPVRLKTANGSVQFYFPVSARLKAREAMLSLEFINSIALMPERSILSVRLNGTTVGQIHLDPQKPKGSAQISLPVELLKPGYNQLSFDASQHYTLECEDPESPELWTEIDTSKSILHIAGDPRTDAPLLSQIGDIFSPGLGGVRDLAIVTGPGDLDNTSFKIGALVAQGVALRTDYEEVTFHQLQAVPTGTTAGDYVLAGTTAQLATLLPKEKLDAITGPTLAVEQAPGDPLHVRFVVTGHTADETLMAARAFSLMDFPFTDAPQMTVSDIHPANAHLPSMAAQYLMPERSYSFKDLGLRTTTIRTDGTHNLPLNIHMPPDLYGAEQATVDLHLDFAYGAGMGPGSVINLMLNNNFVRAIYLNNPQGETFHNYLISIPLRSFSGGANRINFEIIMGAETTGRCMERVGRHLAFAMEDTSQLVMPSVGHYASQPDLGLFGRTGFPYVAPNDIKNSALAVLDPSLAAAGWTLAGKLAQVNKAPLDGIDFVIGWPKNFQSSIVLGPLKALPADVFAAVDYGVGQVHKIPYPSLEHAKGEKVEMLEPFNAIGNKTGSTPQADGYIAQASDLGRESVMLGVQSPGHQGTITVVTARDDDTLDKGISALVQPDMWTLLNGTLAIWRDTPESFAYIDLGDKYGIGDKNSLLGVRYSISHSPALWIAGSLAGLICLAMITTSLIHRGRGRNG